MRFTKVEGYRCFIGYADTQREDPNFLRTIEPCYYIENSELDWIKLVVGKNGNQWQCFHFESGILVPARMSPEGEYGWQPKNTRQEVAEGAIRILKATPREKTEKIIAPYLEPGKALNTYSEQIISTKGDL